jgi:thymidylate synthase (FAD)
MHQDYSEGFVADQRDSWPDETRAGEICVKRLLAGERGHYGPLEHPQITFNAGWFPHDVMQQARTHRIGVSFDVQSGRYTSKRICDVALGKLDVYEVFYLRPVGTYRDRSGKCYEYTEEQRSIDRMRFMDAATLYWEDIQAGFSEEHARRMMPYALRQHFVVSFSLRALMHFLDLRAKGDAQLEIRQLCELIWPHFATWAPQIADWYQDRRWGKARLAP